MNPQAEWQEKLTTAKQNHRDELTRADMSLSRLRQAQEELDVSLRRLDLHVRDMEWAQQKLDRIREDVDREPPRPETPSPAAIQH